MVNSLHPPHVLCNLLIGKSLTFVSGLKALCLLRVVEDESILLNLEQRGLLLDNARALYENLVDMSSYQINLVGIRVVIVLTHVELLGV